MIHPARMYSRTLNPRRCIAVYQATEAIRASPTWNGFVYSLPVEEASAAAYSLRKCYMVPAALILKLTETGSWNWINNLTC